MPLFTYQCLKCGIKLDKLVKRGDDPPSCSGCGKPMKQVWSVPAVAQWKCSRSTL